VLPGLKTKRPEINSFQINRHGSFIVAWRRINQSEACLLLLPLPPSIHSITKRGETERRSGIRGRQAVGLQWNGRDSWRDGLG